MEIKMKIALLLLSLSHASASSINIKADSVIGQKVLSSARRLDENEYDGADFDENWVAGYSVKFQGCHQIAQWNDDADDNSEVRIVTKRLVRFRLCPSDSCSSTSSKGCSEHYGDYILDMNSYLSYYFEAKQTYQSFQCEYLENYACGCDGDEDCLYDCYVEHGMGSVCMQDYSQENENYDFNLEDYMECAKTDYADSNGNSLYVGPYCGSQGGAIFLGVFSDEDCTNFADSKNGLETYQYASGRALPYSAASIVDMDCISCTEPKENNNDGNDNEDADEVSEVCEAIYTLAGKCEYYLPSGTVYEVNNNGCNYMAGIKMIVRKDGTVVTADAKANKTASIFIGIFAVAFALLGAYVYFLKTKLDRASINLAD
jgi:hypothetical protein